MHVSDYCRELESYLCQKNEGHLIRIVGPSFEQVCGWAERGVPLAVAKKGIDQYCERYYAKSPRRRPVRIEFCEADVLELFDSWRRAVGVAAPHIDNGADPPSGDGDVDSRRRDSLTAHLDRTIARLTALRAGGRRSQQFDAAVAETIRGIDGLRAGARQARGGARAALLEQLSALDAALAAAALQEIDDERGRGLRAEADAEIAPFAMRMTAQARHSAAEAAFERLVRDALGIPAIAVD